MAILEMEISQIVSVNQKDDLLWRGRNFMFWIFVSHHSTRGCPVFRQEGTEIGRDP
jgi:hypothetical protein